MKKLHREVGVYEENKRRRIRVEKEREIIKENRIEEFRGYREKKRMKGEGRKITRKVI